MREIGSLWKQSSKGAFSPTAYSLCIASAPSRWFSSFKFSRSTKTRTRRKGVRIFRGIQSERREMRTREWSQNLNRFFWSVSDWNHMRRKKKSSLFVLLLLPFWNAWLFKRGRPRAKDEWGTREILFCCCGMWSWSATIFVSLISCRDWIELILNSCTGWIRRRERWLRDRHARGSWKRSLEWERCRRYRL